MITYSTGTYTDFVVPNFEGFLSFVEESTETSIEDNRVVLDIYKNSEEDVRTVFAHDGETLVGFYLWRPWVKSPFFKNNPGLVEELTSKGFDANTLYVPLLLGVKPTHRRQGIASGMADTAQGVASQEGFEGRVIYLIQTASIRDYKNSRYSSLVTVMDYRDAFGDGIEIYRFA